MAYIALIVALCALAFGLTVLLGVAALRLLRAIATLDEREGRRS